MMQLAQNWWVRLGAALAAAFGLMGAVILNTPRGTSQAAQISDDALLTAETAFAPQQIQALLAARRSPLAGYSETLDGQTLTAGELVWAAAQARDYGLSPQALLTTLYLEDRWNWTAPGGLYAHLKQIALDLSSGYLAGLAPDPAEAKQAANLPRETAATYALARYYTSGAKLAGQVRGSLQDWAAAYRELFGRDPAQAATVNKSPAAVAAPFLRMPFEQPKDSFYPIESFFDHAVPGQVEERNLLRADGKALPAAHYSGCWLAMTCYSGHNATDFSVPMGTPLYAAAAGKVIYRLDSEGGVILDHPNGYRTLYWHMDKILVNWNQEVKDGELLGYSGTRGVSTHPHLHFGLRITALSRDVDPFGWWSTSPDPWVAPSRFMWRGDATADNGEPQLQLFYNQYWTRDPHGLGGSSWYTHTTNQYGSSTNWGLWGTQIARAGRYTVSAYWPKNAENTTAAVFQVWHAGGVSQVTVNQRADGDRFVPLGTFTFDEGPITVELTDLTPNAPPDQRIYFDAVRWTPVGASIYLPVLRAGP